MNKMKILILADGNLKIGMGHVYRSLNLAQELKRQGHEIVFLTKEHDSRKVLSKFYNTKFLQKNNILKEKQIVLNIKPDIVVIDKLRENTRTINFLNKFFTKTIAIDYTGNNKNLIKNSINMLYLQSGAHSGNTNSGLQYSILNNKFRNKRLKVIKKYPKSILVLQGGSDTHCFTPKILESLRHIEQDVKITAVVGPAFRCWKKLKKVTKNHPKKVKILHNISNMDKTMIKHDMAITGGGMTLLELACVGVPSMIICGENFETETAKMMQAKGFGINLGYGLKLSKKQISETTRTLLYNYSLRKKMNKMGPKIIDGKGTKRVAEIITTL